MKAQTNHVEKKDKEQLIVLLAYKGKNKEKTHHLDSRVNNHMRNFKNMFMELDELENKETTSGKLDI